MMNKKMITTAIILIVLAIVAIFYVLKQSPKEENIPVETTPSSKADTLFGEQEPATYDLEENDPDN